tara:strand:+ start:324 stop:563 length:240 start_codon:yes stop_codon:yes gene_type:complete
MGKMSDMLIDGSTNEEMKGMIDNAKAQHDSGYIQFLEEQLEKAETLIRRIKDMADDEVKVSIQESMVSSYINNYYNDKK